MQQSPARQTGFPSPADDHLEHALELSDFIDVHPDATFYLRARGCGSIGEDVRDGDVLVVDRAARPSDGTLVVAAVDGELTFARLRTRGERPVLVTASREYPLGDGPAPELWGVVTYVVHAVGVEWGATS